MHKTGDVLRSSMRAIPWRGAIQKKLIYAGLLGGLLFSSTNFFAANYSCGTASANHCYGQTSWSEQPQYFGAYVDLQEPSMNCPSKRPHCRPRAWDARERMALNGMSRCIVPAIMTGVARKLSRNSANNATHT